MQSEDYVSAGTMPIKQTTAKLIWANAAGRCAFPGCQARLCTEDAGGAAEYTIGEIAHICGDKPGAPRHDANQTDDERNGSGNLLLLCPNHHTEIDKPAVERRFSVEVLRKMKSDHESYVAGRLDAQKFTTKADLAKVLNRLLVENHEVWKAYGPTSDIAKKHPESNAHGVWLSERLATIVPNNRQICHLADDNHGLFGGTDQALLARFKLHARTYEKWVVGEVDYEAVQPFPQEFSTMIAEAANAGA